MSLKHENNETDMSSTHGVPKYIHFVETLIYGMAMSLGGTFSLLILIRQPAIIN